MLSSLVKAFILFAIFEVKINLHWRIRHPLHSRVKLNPTTLVHQPLQVKAVLQLDFALPFHFEDVVWIFGSEFFGVAVGNAVGEVHEEASFDGFEFDDVVSKETWVLLSFNMKFSPAVQMSYRSFRIMQVPH